MHQMRRVVAAHAVTFLMGSLYLAWLALPVGEGQWRIDPTIHWWWLLVPAALLGVAAGICQGLVVGSGRFWPTIVPLVPASAAACGRLACSPPRRCSGPSRSSHHRRC